LGDNTASSGFAPNRLMNVETIVRMQQHGALNAPYDWYGALNAPYDWYGALNAPYDWLDWLPTA
jgi:hypothetical protein